MSEKLASGKLALGKTRSLRPQPCRIGFYICHCGLNIAGKVDVEKIRDYVATLEGIEISRDYKFMCSDPGQTMIERDIQSLELNRVVVASCSPRLHGKTFMETCRRAGLNPYYFQMCSVREQVSWVTKDPILATQKAKHLVTAAIKRVNFHTHLETKISGVNPDVAIIGGGIAGMQAAIDIGNSGHKAFLIEKDTTIGGHMLQFDKTFPTLDCAACIGTPKMVEVGQNTNIKLFSFSEVTHVSGFIGNFILDIKKKPRYINEDLCTACGECTNVCPVSIPNPWDMGMAPRKAIGRAFPQAIPITFNIEKKDRAPCRLTCPAGTNVQGYVQMVKIGNYQQALNLIMERLPLPGVLGRVCPHPCESDCRRGLVDSAISIRDLKRFAADNANLADVPLPEVVEIDKRVAIIGSGPVGLTVAYYLRRKGFKPTIFEAMEKPGGMLRTGIPDYRLPPAILDQEIDHILSTGVELKTGHTLGSDFTLASLKDDGFDVIFLGIGAHVPVKMNIENEEADGVVDAVPFLRRENLERPGSAKKRVVVIGGGNVAMGAARVAVRSGAETVAVVYRRSEKEMPADHEEIEGAKEEGVEFFNLVETKRVVTENNKVIGIECIKNELGPADASGRRRPVPVEGSESIIDCDMIIPAIGQRVESAPVRKDTNIDLTAWGTFTIDPDTMETSISGVFAAGDAVTGPATVVEAIASGHKVVTSIERYLNQEMELFDQERKVEMLPVEDDFLPLPEGAALVARAKSAVIDPSERKFNFDEVDLGLSEEFAQSDADKCINCGGCCECMECVSVCEAAAIDHSMTEETIQIAAGSIILATGYDTLEPTSLKQFGYGRFANVFSALEFERLSNATGPTGGKILIRNERNEFTRQPQSVAIVHCVGSRDVNYHEYCSRVCCMYALKYTHLIKEKVGQETKVYDFYIDMRCFGEGYEEFYRRCQEEGTIFIRGKVAQITDKATTASEQGKLIAIAEDTLLGELVRVPVDMVILCTAIQARKDAGDIGRVLGVNQGGDGFFLEEHPKLAPLNTAVDGVFLCGCCQKPMDIPDTVSQASGAAVKALSLATKGRVDISPTISHINPDICVGCKTCISLCPYAAIEFDDRRKVSVVNEAICKGCGSCSGFCPSGAAQSRHFTKKQIFAEISGIF